MLFATGSGRSILTAAFYKWYITLQLQLLVGGQYKGPNILRN